MATAAAHDFSELDNAKISKQHWQIMFISGMGFFTDAYDLFIIGVVMSLIKPIWHIGKVKRVLSTRLRGGAGGFALHCAGHCRCCRPGWRRAWFRPTTTGR